MKIKSILFAFTLLICSFTASAQHPWSLKGGIGTSWVIFPKVFLVDPDNFNNVWVIGPGRNNVTAYVGGDIAFTLSDHWFIGTGVSFNYTSGQIRITTLEKNASAREVQTYTRLGVPLIFGVKSSDDFWFTFGPGIFFNLGDNEGFKNAVEKLTSADNVNTTRTVGFEAKVGIGLMLSDNLFLDILFSSDIGKRFDYENGTYEVRMSMQGTTVGIGYIFNNK